MRKARLQLKIKEKENSIKQEDKKKKEQYEFHLNHLLNNIYKNILGFYFREYFKKKEAKKLDDQFKKKFDMNDLKMDLYCNILEVSCFKRILLKQLLTKVIVDYNKILQLITIESQLRNKGVYFRTNT